MTELKHFLRRLHYRIRDADLVWRWLNREAIRKHAKDGVRVFVPDLFYDGIARTDMGHLGLSTLLSEMQEKFDEAMGNATLAGSKANVINWKTKEETFVIDPEDPFVRFALEPKILDIVSAYLGMWPILQDIVISRTVVMPNGAEPKDAHNAFWHRDTHDVETCKVFLYLTDVDEGSGPFFYAKGTQRGGVLESIHPQNRPKGSQPQLEGKRLLIPDNCIEQALGPAGTVVFADTAGLHKGGLSTRNERRTVTLSYFTPAHTHRLRRYVLPAESKDWNLTERQRFALKAHVGA